MSTNDTEGQTNDPTYGRINGQVKSENYIPIGIQVWYNYSETFLKTKLGFVRTIKLYKVTFGNKEPTKEQKSEKAKVSCLNAVNQVVKRHFLEYKKWML